MKERPILFSAPMVRALLNGTKTQTRRVMKVQPPDDTYKLATCISTTGNRKDEGRQHWLKADEHIVKDGGQPYFSCPYGQPGDRLWVKETGWQRPERTPRMMREGADTWAPYYFDADGLSEQDHADFKAWGFKRRPSIFMPRECSRITLEVTGVRVERLNDISDEDARAEGINRIAHGREGYFYHATRTEPHPNNWCFPDDAYKDLWEQINGPGSWAANPWVWVVEFKRLTARAKGE